MKRAFSFLTLFCCVFLLCGQNNITLKFTAQDATQNWRMLNRVVVTNVTRGWQEILYYPDTLLQLQCAATGIENGQRNADGLHIEVRPNPFDGATEFILATVGNEMVGMEICDLKGVTLTTATYQPRCTNETAVFKVTIASPQTCLLRVSQNGAVAVAKLVNTGNGGRNAIEPTNRSMENARLAAPKLVSTKPCQLGDHLEFVGYALVCGSMSHSATVTHTLAQSDDVTLTLDLSAVLPSVQTLPVSDISVSSANSGGDVLNEGCGNVTARGICWSTLAAPTLADTHTADGAGTGTFASSMTGLAAGTNYHVRAYATNSVGTAYGNELVFVTPKCEDVLVQETDTIYQGDSVLWHGNALTATGVYYDTVRMMTGCDSVFEMNLVVQVIPFNCGIDNVVDIDGNSYETILIDEYGLVRTQCWMKQNLKTTRYADGTAIPMGGYDSSSHIAYRYYPDNNYSYVYQYGYLYNWQAVMHGDSSSNAVPSGVQGICPDGWHVPSHAELESLTNYVSLESAYWCGGNSTAIGKALASTYGWRSTSAACAAGNDPYSNNATGFSAVPAGSYDGIYLNFSGYAFHWSSTETAEPGYAYYLNVPYSTSRIYHTSRTMAFACSVRCVKD